MLKLWHTWKKLYTKNNQKVGMQNQLIKIQMISEGAMKMMNVGLKVGL